MSDGPPILRRSHDSRPWGRVGVGCSCGLFAPSHSNQNVSCPAVASFSSTSLFSTKTLHSENSWVPDWLANQAKLMVGMGNLWLVDVLA